MTFSFNFALDEESKEEEQNKTRVVTTTHTAAASLTPHTRHGERFQWSQTVVNTSFSAIQIPMDSGESLMFDITNTNDPGFLAQTGTISAILTTSDLQAGVYEGGFKLWECAVDLVKYMEEECIREIGIPSKVMELGCGHGLPGIHALRRGAEHVAFLDYNKEVLELTTCPNVLKNVQHDARMYERALFYAGAWESVSHYMQNMESQSSEDMQYDLILTAETIYTEAVTVELYEMIKRHLRRAPTSRALVAAKKYYFGTGGSVQHFLNIVNTDGIFQAKTVWEEQDCRSNIREIVQLTYAIQ